MSRGLVETLRMVCDLVWLELILACGCACLTRQRGPAADPRPAPTRSMCTRWRFSRRRSPARSSGSGHVRGSGLRARRRLTCVPRGACCTPSPLTPSFRLQGAGDGGDEGRLGAPARPPAEFADAAGSSAAVLAPELNALIARATGVVSGDARLWRLLAVLHGACGRPEDALECRLKEVWPVRGEGVGRTGDGGEAYHPPRSAARCRAQVGSQTPRAWTACAPSPLTSRTCTRMRCACLSVVASR